MKNEVKKNKQRIKEKKYRSEEQEQIIKFCILLLIVVGIVVAIYFITNFIVKKDSASKDGETAVTEVQYNTIIFGMLLNRPYKEYYALAFSSKDNQANYYNYLATAYTQKDDSSKLYYIDTNDSLNSEYVSKTDAEGSNANSLDKIRVGKIALIKVENGKIVKCLSDISEIEKELK